MFEIGRICVKIAGRDAGMKCVVLSEIDNNTVLVDGETRRRKVNLKHLEPLNQEIKIKANASHADVVEAFKKLGLEPMSTKPKKAGQKPKKTRKASEKPAAEPKAEKKEEAKAEQKPAKKEEKKSAKKK